MKIYQALYLIISSFFFLSSVANADIHTSSIEISGTVVEPTCNIDMPNEVDLGKHSRAIFNGTELPYVTTFKIDFLGCSKRKKTLIFTSSGDYDETGTVLLNQGTAKNVVIVLIAKTPDGGQRPLQKIPPPFDWEIKDGPVFVDVSLYHHPEEEIITPGSIIATYMLEVSYK